MGTPENEWSVIIIDANRKTISVYNFSAGVLTTETRPNQRELIQKVFSSFLELFDQLGELTCHKHIICIRISQLVLRS